MLSVTMLSVDMLNVVMLSVVMLNVVMLSVVMLSVVMLNVVMLSVVMLSVVAPGLSFFHDQSFFLSWIIIYYPFYLITLLTLPHHLFLRCAHDFHSAKGSFTRPIWQCDV
jgi:hypothetical protein